MADSVRYCSDLEKISKNEYRAFSNGIPLHVHINF